MATMMPTVAATEAKIRLFFKESMVSEREKWWSTGEGKVAFRHQGLANVDFQAGCKDGGKGYQYHQHSKERHHDGYWQRQTRKPMLA